MDDNNNVMPIANFEQYMDEVGDDVENTENLSPLDKKVYCHLRWHETYDTTEDEVSHVFWNVAKELGISTYDVYRSFNTLSGWGFYIFE